MDASVRIVCNFQMELGKIRGPRFFLAVLMFNLLKASGVMAVTLY